MQNDNLLSKREEEILTCIGYLVMRWNYAERCARQILRQYISEDSIDDPAHLKLSTRTAKWIEDELKTIVLPRWQAPRREFLERLIDAYAVAREHRNHFVHGIYATADTHGSNLAQAVLIPPMPKNNRTQIPTYVTVADISAIANHINELSSFAREVMIGFDVRGGRALNADGSPVLAQLPAVILPLKSCDYLTT